MCGLFGYSYYGVRQPKKISELTKSLAEQSASRGTDATGISYIRNREVIIAKQPKSAYRIKFNHPEDVAVLTGHTRHSTQGSEKKNYNNHPFYGKCGNTKFAFAHNGVLMNDEVLNMRYNFPNTKIETDSYVGVKLLETKKHLNFDSIKFMAEEIEGSFSFSILDNDNNIYLVKGDSPLSIIHFPEEKIYVYASTDEILYKALIDTPLFDSLREKKYEIIEMEEGQILKICSNGKLKYGKFKFNQHYGRRWYEYGYFDFGYKESDYISDLKTVAAYQGYSPDDVDELLHNGFSLEEIEDYIYGMEV